MGSRSLALNRGLVLLVVVLVAKAAVAVDTYRWRDREGLIHFGDRPPAGSDAEKITVRTQRSRLSADEAAQKIERLRAIEARNKPADKITATPTTLDAAKRERCAHAQWALSALETARPVYRDEQGMYRIKRPRGHVDPYTGERAYLDDATRAREIVIQKKIIQENCGAQPTADEKARVEKEILAAEHCEAAAAELGDLMRAGRDQDTDRINTRREYLDTYCESP